MRVQYLASIVFALALTSQVKADQAPASAHQQLSPMTHEGMNLPGEPGQSAFAAIQEIVTMLEADPRTDWSKVNIEALRQHLIDMNSVTMNSSVKVEAIPDGRKFVVTGDGDVAGSIQRMLSGHAATMNGKDGWSFVAAAISNGAVLTVKPPRPELLVKLDGLGLIGVLAMGMHHQEHHWMIAKGMHPH